MPALRTPRSRYRDWYSVSSETLRGWAIFLLLAAVAAIAAVQYLRTDRENLRAEAIVLLETGEQQLTRLERNLVPGNFRAELEAVRAHLDATRTRLAEKDDRAAVRHARQARDVLAAVQGGPSGRLPGDAQFLNVAGDVEYRRGSSGSWEVARPRIVLRAGDAVKTSSSGSAEIVFGDGTLYTARPNSYFLVTRSGGGSEAGGEQSIRMEYGWVNLNTAERPSEITTPGASARVREQSEASVSYEKGAAVARFTALRGSLEVATNQGGRQEVRELEQVVQAGDRLSDPRRLPSAPALEAPGDNEQLAIEASPRAVLAWTPVAGAVRYSLQVSRSRLFTELLIDDANRATTRATLGLRGEGIFQWRVAAVNREGTAGPWSAPRQFRVVRAERMGEADRTPPVLQLEDVKSYGNLVIVAGRTEPGATVRVNGEPVAVDAEGLFRKTVQLVREGWNVVEVQASDAWGNDASRRPRVFVEAL